MKHDEFIKHVQNVAQLNSREEAERATRSTLETLKERVVGDEASQLAAQLPQALGQHLRGREGENGQHFSVHDFIARVSEAEGVDQAAAKNHVRAVFAVLQQAVTPGAFDDIRVNLSDDYAELLTTAPTK